MKTRSIAWMMGALLMAATAVAQDSQLPPPSPVEQQLAAKASDVTEVTLGKNMLDFAAKFMNDKHGDNDADARKLIQGLQGIYVRDYEFDKEGEYTPEQVEELRHHYEVGDWTPIVRERDRKSHETTDVLMKMVNGESRGLFVLDAEPKDLTIVLILGPIRMDDLSKLSGLSGLSGLAGIEGLNGARNTSHGKSGGTQ